VNNEGKEDKAKGNTREGDLIFFLGNIFHMREREGEEREFWIGLVFLDLLEACLRSLLEEFHRGHLLLGILGLGARKP
jgi:hypothetical protein